MIIIIKRITPLFLIPIIERIEVSHLSHRLARGAFWSLVGALASRGLGLFASILVARMLGKSGFGELGIIQSTIGMFGTFAGFGLGMTATKFIAEFRTTDPAKAGRVRALSSTFAWVTSGITTLILYFLANWLAENSLGAPHLAGLLRISSIFLFFSAINGAQIGVLSGFEAFKTVAKINFLGGLVNVPLMVGGVYLAGVTGAVWALGLAMALNWILNHIAIRHECRKANIPYTYEGFWAERKVLWSFSLPALISGLFFAPTEWILNSTLVNQPGGFSQMGLFNAAKQWHILILYIPSMISNLTLPILSNLMGEGNNRQYRKMVIWNSVGITAIAFIVAIPIAILSPYIMGAYGNDFSSGYIVLLWVCFYSVLWAANIVVGQVLWSTGSTSLAMLLAALRAFLLIVLFNLTNPKTALTLAVVYTITYALQTIYQGVLSAYCIKKSLV